MGTAALKAPKASADPRTLPLDSIEPHPLNPRKEFDPVELRRLAETMDSMGLMEPVVVRRVDGARNRYQLIAGERRLRAAALAGWKNIPVNVRNVSDAEALAMQLVENLQRVDLNAIEKARGVEQLCRPIEDGGGGKTHRMAAELFGHRASWVTNLIRLLRLPESWQSKIVSGEITEAQGRLLVQFADKPEKLAALEADIAANPWFYRTREDFMRSIERLFPRSQAKPVDVQVKATAAAAVRKAVSRLTGPAPSAEPVAGGEAPIEDDAQPATVSLVVESILAAIGDVQTISDLERIIEACLNRRDAIDEIVSRETSEVRHAQ